MYVCECMSVYVTTPHAPIIYTHTHTPGRCASRVPSVIDKCMATLLTLVVGFSPTIVGRAVVVMRQLLQNKQDIDDGVIRSMARLLERVTVPEARAAIVWTVGEYQVRMCVFCVCVTWTVCTTNFLTLNPSLHTRSRVKMNIRDIMHAHTHTHTHTHTKDRVATIAPDVLRKLAKSFQTEETNVKMQILNLAVKLGTVCVVYACAYT
jgi:vesicle coat complex subunit